MYNIQDSINKTYDFIQGLKNKGYKYGGYPVYNVTKEDLEALNNVGAKYGIPFEWLVNLIKHESASTFNPSITNSIGATGLIQFMTTINGKKMTYAKANDSSPVDTSSLRKMTFSEQLDYVDGFLKRNLKRYLNAEGKIPSNFTQGDVFMTIFYPVSIGKSNYIFPDSVKKANGGISTPMDYVKKALKSPIFSLDEIPYTLEDFKKKISKLVKDSTQTIKRNPMITVLITTVVILGIFTLYKTLKA